MTTGILLLLLSRSAQPAAAAPPAGARTLSTPAMIAAETTWTTIVLVRHAEKDTTRPGDDVPLDPKGQRRARELARVLGDLPTHRIIVTPRQRSRQTAQPLAARRGDTLTVIPEVERTIETLRAAPPGSTVLVVGHSNTLPRIIEGLTGRPFPTPGHVAHDGMWIVTRTAGGASRLLVLRYGEPDDLPSEMPRSMSQPAAR